MWWKMEKDKKRGEEHTWKEFHELFLGRYFPMSVHEKKRKEFLYLIQGNKTVMEYDREFNKLSRFARSLIATDKDRVERFLNGLQMTLQKDLSLFMLPTHAEALDKALKAEWMREQMAEEQKTEEKKRSAPNDTPREKKVQEKKVRWTNAANVENKKGCGRCGRDHEMETCPWTTGACFRCGEKGHKIANCPQQAE